MHLERRELLLQPLDLTRQANTLSPQLPYCLFRVTKRPLLQRLLERPKGLPLVLQLLEARSMLPAQVQKKRNAYLLLPLALSTEESERCLVGTSAIAREVGEQHAEARPISSSLDLRWKAEHLLANNCTPVFDTQPIRVRLSVPVRLHRPFGKIPCQSDTLVHTESPSNVDSSCVDLQIDCKGPSRKLRSGQPSRARSRPTQAEVQDLKEQALADTIPRVLGGRVLRRVGQQNVNAGSQIDLLEPSVIGLDAVDHDATRSSPWARSRAPTRKRTSNASTNRSKVATAASRR